MEDLLGHFLESLLNLDMFKLIHDVFHEIVLLNLCILLHLFVVFSHLSRGAPPLVKPCFVQIVAFGEFYLKVLLQAVLFDKVLSDFGRDPFDLVLLRRINLVIKLIWMPSEGRKLLCPLG